MSSIKIRTKRLKEHTEIRTLITHPMENGRHKDKHDQLIPAHHIQELWVEHNDTRVITCHMAGGISKNPFFTFLLKGGDINDKITITWIDNLTETDSQSYFIK